MLAEIAPIFSTGILGWPSHRGRVVDMLHAGHNLTVSRCTRPCTNNNGHFLVWPNLMRLSIGPQTQYLSEA